MSRLQVFFPPSLTADPSKRGRRAFALLAAIMTTLSCNAENAVTPSGVPNVATQLALAVQPASVISGVVFDIQPVIRTLDANGQLAQSNVQVTVAVTRGAVALEGTRSVNAVAGIATFTDLQVNGGGELRLTFSAPDLEPVSLTLLSKQTPKSLGLVRDPDGAEIGLPFPSQPVVRLLDHANLPIRDTAFAVTASIGTGSGTLSGTRTVVTANGLATFTNLTINEAGVHSLLFEAGTATPAHSVDFLVAGPTHLVLVQKPDTSRVNTAFSRQPVLELRGENNTVMRGASAPVVASVGNGSGTLSGTTTVTAIQGVVTFTNLKLDAKGLYTLAFATVGLDTVRSDSFPITAPPVALGLDTLPLGAVSGSVLATQPVIAIVDAANERAIDAAVPVTVTITAGATLLGTTTVNAAGGVARFTNLRVDGPSGVYTMRFAAPGLLPVTTNIVVTQTVGSLSVVTHANGAATGIPFTTQPVVRVLDKAGLPMPTATTPVTVAIASGSGVLNGPATVNAVGGVASFKTLSITGGGQHTLSFSATGATGVSSAAFLVSQTASMLAVVTQPGNATRNLPFQTQPVVHVRDGAGGLVLTSTAIVTATLTSGTGQLLGARSVAAVNGVATFGNLAIDAAGVHTITFTSLILSSAVSTSFTVSGPPIALAPLTEPAGAVSGQALTTQPVVTVRDSANQLAAGSTAPVTAALASGTGTLVGTTVVNAVAGVATFTNLRVNGAGPHTMSFTSGSLTPATSATFTASQGAASLGMETQPTGAETGQPLATQPRVQVLDGAGLQVADATTAVTAAIASGTGTLSGTTTVAASNGLATFTDLTIVGEGPHVLQFTATDLASATSSELTITQTPVALGVQSEPGGATIGLALTTPPSVRILDALGNLVSASTLSVTVSVASGPGTLSGTTTVAAVNGVATFDAIALSAAGAHTLTFTSGSFAPVTSASFAVSDGPAKLSIQTQPTDAISGIEFTAQPVVRVLDGSDNLAGGFTGPVTVAIAAGSGQFHGTLTVNAVGGVATFTDLSLAGSGSHTLTFTSGALTGATSTPFAVTQTPLLLALQAQPTGSVSGSALTGQPVVEVLDHAGLRIETSTLAVTVAIASGTGTLVGTTTVDAIQGVATFAGVRIDGSGSHTLAFSGSGVNGVTSNAFATTQNATALVMDRQPSNGASGVALPTQPRVRVEDVTQHVVAGATTAVTAALASGTGALSGTTTVNAVNGIATFTNLAVAGGGSHTLTFTATDLTPATSAAFTVSQTPASLGMETQPAGAISGLPLSTQPAVRIRDSGNLLVGNATNTVTVSLASGNGTLVGNKTINAQNGIATFTDLRINGFGPHTLQFSSPGLSSVVSASVTVTQQAVALGVETQPGGAFTGVSFVLQPRIRILDHAGLQVQGATNAVSTSITAGPGTLSGATTVSAVNGLATFSGLAITGEALHTLAFTSGSLTGTTSSQFLVYGSGDENGAFLIHSSCTENPTPAVAAPLRTFYVNPVTGDDANTGTLPEIPWRTLARANNTVIAGDLVYLKGVFSGQVIRPVNSGTATNKIVFRALPDDSARITLGTSGVALSFSNLSHIVVDRIAITNVTTPILITNNSHHIQLSNLTILNSGSSEINNADDNWIDRSFFQRIGTAGVSGDAIVMRNGAERNFFTRNVVKEAGRSAVHVGPTSATDLVARDNQVLQNNLDNFWGTGVFLGPRSEGTILECNRVQRAGTGSTPRSGIEVAGTGNIVRFNDVFQNAVFGVVLQGRTFGGTAQPAVNNTVSSNSIWGNTSGSIRVVLTFTP